jgi:hypothetical protein
MARAPKIDHLARLGLKPHPDKTMTRDNTRRDDVEILGRRSRKVWPCAAAVDRDCSVGLDIDLDEVYIEHAEGVRRFDGRTSRYHVACAINKQIVIPVENAIDKGNSRRAAIQAQKARKAANAS